MIDCIDWLDSFKCHMSVLTNFNVRCNMIWKVVNDCFNNYPIFLTKCISIGSFY